MSSQPVGCYLCSADSVEECGRCGCISYCADHKEYHSDDETGVCFPYRVEYVQNVGRIMVSTRDILPGEVVFKEQELVVGPCKTSKPLCLGCGREVDGTVTCSCTWPICSLSCPEGSRHSQEECRILSLDSQTPRDCEDFCGILPLRVLLLSHNQLQYFLQFMDHGESRSENHQYLVDLVQQRWKQGQYSAKLITRVEGILDINTVEHRVQDSESARSFLPITSLASHSCVSNSIKDKTEAGCVKTRARVKISQGEEITFHYTGGLKGRLMRRTALRSGWFFWCTCPRCTSSSELGSEMSSLRCQAGACGGAVRPVYPVNQDSSYRCENCGVETCAEQVAQVERELTDKLENCYRNDTVAIERLLEEAEEFHTNHFLKLIMKWLLVTSWGSQAGLENSSLPDQTLEKKIVLCKEYLSVLDIVDPGLSHNRGLTLWELHSAHTFLINKKFKEEKLSPVKFLAGLEESLKIVEEAIWCLQFNQENTVEHRVQQLAVSAQQNISRTAQFFSKALNQGISSQCTL